MTGEKKNDQQIGIAFIVLNKNGKYQCNECSKLFKTLKRYLVHIKTHDNNFSKADLKSLEVIYFHLYIRMKFNIYCNSSIRKECLEKPDDKIDDLFCEKVEYENGQVMFCCKFCNVEFDTKKRLLLHSSIHRNVATAKTKGEKMLQTENTFNCQTCNKSFQSEMDFELHFQAHEGNLKKELAQIKATSESFNVKMPSKIGIHTCQFCQKEFKRPHEKVKHEVCMSIRRQCQKNFNVSG